MKKIAFTSIICILFISGCTYNGNTVNTDNDENNKIQELKKSIKRLESDLKEKNDYIEKLEQQQAIFPILSNIALEFVRGHTQGNIEKLKEIISDSISIIEEENKIYGKYEVYGNEIKYLLYNNDGEIGYEDMVIQGYGYYEENNTYVIHIREFYVDEYNEPVSPPTFLNLYFRELEEGWRIIEFDFDV